MKIVVFGLSLSSSWGNGHATTYRALLKALAARGHEITFFERDASWYADNRDLPAPTYCSLVLYTDLDIVSDIRKQIKDADLVIIGSYVPEAIHLARLLRPIAKRLAFYDIDTPVTLAALERGEWEYISPDTIPLYDIYLSFSGGPLLELLKGRYGAARAEALFCAVDPEQYYFKTTEKIRRWALGYLGTYSDDRQPTLDTLLLETARQSPDLEFVVAGPQYPSGIDWPGNVQRIEHLPPALHADFYNDLCWALNVTRSDMVAAGHSPSVRLFEASACGVPIISDAWVGLSDIFEVGKEIEVATTTHEVLRLLATDSESRQAIGLAGRSRTLAQHTAAHRAVELECCISNIPAHDRSGVEYSSQRLA